MTTERNTAGNSGLAKDGLTCFVETFVQASTFALRMNICGKNRQLLVGANVIGNACIRIPKLQTYPQRKIFVKKCSQFGNFRIFAM
jgi:hypothetical protein